LHFGSIEGDRIFRELEAFLDQRGELTDPAALLAEDFLGVCGADDLLGLVGVAMMECSKENRGLLISVTVGVTRTSTPE